MKTILALASLAVCSLAQVSTDSAPFRLFVRSSNETLNGTALGACHEGAATESLCPTGEKESDPAASYTTFYHRTYAAQDSSEGILFWNLTYNFNQSAPSAMQFSSSETSNVVIPIFTPGNVSSTYVSFDDKGCLYIGRNIDDTVSPPAYLNTTEQVKNWYVCLTRYGYLYETLAWKVGVTGEPQNPSCQPVQVQRAYV